jgi:hypothetical protein
MIIGLKYIKPHITIDLPIVNMASCSISQDLFTPHLSGVLHLSDRDSWQNLMPTLGDKLEILFAKPIIPLDGESKERLEIEQQVYTFDVYKSVQGDIDMTKRPFRDLFIYFTAGNMVDAYSTSISRTYDRKTFNSIAKDLCKRVSVTPKFFETFTNPITYTAPLWTPIKTLTDLSNYTLTSDNKGGLLFFQDFSGTLNFITIPSLLEGKMGNYENVYWYNHQSKEKVKENIGLFASNLNFNRCFTMQMVRTPNYLKLANKGLFNSNFTYFDLEQNKVVTIEKNISNTKRTTPNKLSKFMNVPPEYLSMFQTNFNFVMPTTDLFNSHKGFVDTKLNRCLMDMYELSAVLPGYIDRKVGMIVEIDVPAQLITNQENEEYCTPDNVYSGKYLIKSITNNFYPDSYTQEINFISDGINSNEYNKNIKEW